MTISAYQVDSVISAYSKQNKIKLRHGFSPDNKKNDKYEDVVSLSGQGIDKTEAYKKISYSLMDVILKKDKAI